MNFVQWLSSLDEILYELMAWVLFYPITLWKIVRSPIRTMKYAEDQLTLPKSEQFRATVSPPIMLVLTIVVIQGVGIAVGDGVSPIVASHHGLAALVNDNTSLLLLRLALFGLFALVLAARKVRRSGTVINRDTLKPPFYAQCYAIAPFALLASGGVTIAISPDVRLAPWGLAATLGGFIYYAVVQIRWFSVELGQTRLRSSLDVLFGMALSIAITLGLGLLFR